MQHRQEWMPPCSIEGCNTPSHTRGLCCMHNRRRRLYGDPLLTKPDPQKSGPKIRPVADRFWSKVDRREPDECWPWLGARTTKGYGKLGGSASKWMPAQRVSYRINIGPIPRNYEVDHLCFNPSCVNPKHLEAVTPAENKRRSIARRGINAKGQFNPAP